MLSHARRLYSVSPVKATNKKLYAAAAEDEGKRRPLSAQGCARTIPQTHVHHASCSRTSGLETAYQHLQSTIGYCLEIAINLHLVHTL
jgi:hypothetical protein